MGSYTILYVVLFTLLYRFHFKLLLCNVILLSSVTLHSDFPFQFHSALSKNCLPPDKQASKYYTIGVLYIASHVPK